MTRPSSAELLRDACPDFPPDLARAYAQAGYWRGDTFGDALRDMAARFGPRIALSEPGRSLSYDVLADRVQALAGGFSALGLARGDVAVVQMPNRIAFVEVVLALTLLGVVPVMALPAHRRQEIRAFCEHARARAYVIPDRHAGFDHAGLAAELQAELPDLAHVVVDGAPLAGQVALDGLFTGGALPDAGPQAGDVAILQISGGTTGIPKLIPRRHQEYLHNIRAAAQASGLGPDSVFLCVLPVAHNFPFACPGVMGTLMSGGRVVMTQATAPADQLAIARAEDVTFTALVPAVILSWLAEARDRPLAHLRQLQSGGARLPHEAALRVRDVLGCPLQQVFGMAEGLICMTPLDGDDAAICRGETFPISPGDELRVVDAQGNPAGQGLIQVRGPYTMRGYFDAPDKNAESFDDGFYVSGDLVRRGPDGAITVIGRMKEQINRGGEKLAAEDVENALIAHPAVRDAVVVGLPDPDLGERICAFVISDGVGVLALRRFLRDRGLATYKMPDDFRLIADYPVTGIGKPNRRMLRQLLRDEALAGVAQ